MSVMALHPDELRATALRLSPFALGVAGLVSVLVGCWLLLRASSSPDVAQLSIEGPFERVTAREVEAALAPQLSQDFLEVDLAQARDALAKLPWISRSRVERMWPGTLRVHVWERQPYARWNASSLLDTESRAFTPPAAELPEGLPQLGGSEGQEQEVVETYRRLSARLSASPFLLAALIQDARGEWTARTQDDIELRFGQGRPDDKLDMLLGAALAKLGADLPQVAYIDLRYTNGFAVGWRSAPVEERSDKNG